MGEKEPGVPILIFHRELRLRARGGLIPCGQDTIIFIPPTRSGPYNAPEPLLLGSGPTKSTIDNTHSYLLLTLCSPFTTAFTWWMVVHSPAPPPPDASSSHARPRESPLPERPRPRARLGWSAGHGPSQRRWTQLARWKCSSLAEYLLPHVANGSRSQQVYLRAATRQSRSRFSCCLERDEDHT